MADLGNIGHTSPSQIVHWADGPFTRTKAPTSVLVNIEDAPVDSVVALFTRGVLVDRVRVDAAGDAFFYDLDDGNYIAEVVYSQESGQEGNAWSINVAGAVVTITIIASSGITGSMSFA